MDGMAAFRAKVRRRLLRGAWGTAAGLALYLSGVLLEIRAIALVGMLGLFVTAIGVMSGAFGPFLTLVLGGPGPDPRDRGGRG